MVHKKGRLIGSKAGKIVGGGKLGEVGSVGAVKRKSLHEAFNGDCKRIVLGDVSNTLVSAEVAEQPRRSP